MGSKRNVRKLRVALSWLVPVLALGSLSSRTGFVPASPSAEGGFRLGDVIDPFEGGEYSFATVPGCDHLGLAGHPNLVSSGDGGPTTHEVLMRNPAFVNRTDFVVAHCNVGNRGRPENRGVDVLARLPPRGPRRPYVVYAPGLMLDGRAHSTNPNVRHNCRLWRDLFRTRDDFLYVMMERGEPRLCDNRHGMLPGFGVLPIRHENRRSVPVNRTAVLLRRRLVFFAGTNHCGWHESSMARPWLFGSYGYYGYYAGAIGGDTLVRAHMDSGKYFTALDDTRFALVPRGDCRWNHRLLDILEAGAIPVFLSDGFEPPYGPLIRWESCSLHYPETAAIDLGALRRRLLEIPAGTVEEMGRNVRKVYRECFESPSKRSECMLRSVRILIDRQTFDAPPAKFAERMTMPLCPSNVRVSDDTGRARYWNNSFETWDRLY